MEKAFLQIIEAPCYKWIFSKLDTGLRRFAFGTLQTLGIINSHSFYSYLAIRNFYLSLRFAFLYNSSNFASSKTLLDS